MLFPYALFALVAVGSATTNLVEERAAQSCTIKSIQDIVTAVYKSSAVPFCNAYLSAPTKTVTISKTNTPTGTGTLTRTATVTAVMTQATTIQSTLKARSLSDGATSENSPFVQPAAATFIGDIEARDDVERRAPTFTPSRFRSLSPSMISSVCGCLTTTATTTVTNIKTASRSVVTTVVTSTITKTTQTTIRQTVTASPVPFYLKVATTSGTSVDGMYGLVNGETMDFVSGTGGASKFIINAKGYLISQTNSWIANMQSGLNYGTLFFDSDANIAQFALVQASCNTTTGSLQCKDQNATTLYYCDYFGAELAIASASYQGAGCKHFSSAQSNSSKSSF